MTLSGNNNDFIQDTLRFQIGSFTAKISALDKKHAVTIDKHGIPKVVSRVPKQ